MINRLQFRHHTPIFDTREDAINYIYREVKWAEEGLAADDKSYGFSLFAEPIAIRYKNEEDESDPHVILAIGADTNPGVNTGNGQYADNRFCIIDINKTESEIEELREEIEGAVKSLSLIVKNTNTLKLYSEKTEEGTVLSGDVAIASSQIFDDVRKPNIILNTEDGLFTYVNLEFNEEDGKLTFTVNGETKEWGIMNNYLVSGYYDRKDESLHLIRKDGEDIVVDLEELIDEWGVEGEASKTPIVLTREEVGYGDDAQHSHVEPWQDVLKADIRLSERRYNILKKSSDGRYLYVDGLASNITYFQNGEEISVQEALSKVGKGVSSDSTNIIYEKADGMYATASLRYINRQNKLVFTTSNSTGGTSVEEIQLNAVEAFKNIYYDPVTENLVILYVDGNGDLKETKIPIGEMLTDWEWDIQNEGHNVRLSKRRVVNGNDKVSADVNIYESDDNILVDKVHQLYVKGTADNIKYGDTNVGEELEKLDDATSDLSDKIGEGFSSRNTVRDEIDAISSAVDGKLSDIVNHDHSIDINKQDEIRPVISVNLSEETIGGLENIIKLNNDGLFAGVDLDYHFDEEVGTNTLVFSTTNGSKRIELQTNSVVDKIYYDAEKEAIVIEYTVNGHRMPDVIVPVSGLIREWRVDDGHDGAIQLTKEMNTSGTTAQDVLYASVVVSQHNDNILVNDGGSLYVSGAQIAQNKSDIEALNGSIGTIGDDLANEISNRESADNNLSALIHQEEDRAKAAESGLTHSLDMETAARQTLEGKVQDIEGEITDLEAKDDDLQNQITAEATTARAAESSLSNAIVSESAERQTADAEIGASITAEVSRAQGAENTLDVKIDAEKSARETEDAKIWAKIRPIEFYDTTTVHNDRIRNSGETPDEVRHSIILSQSDDNIILASDNLGGMYATAKLGYNESANALTIYGPNDKIINTVTLGPGSLIKDISYDSAEKDLVITYRRAGEDEDTIMKFPVADLFNEWEVENHTEGSAIELTKVSQAGETGNVDKLSARVLLTGAVPRPDGTIDYGDNLIRIVNNGLYVSGGDAEEAKEEAQCAINEIKTIERAVLGSELDSEQYPCGEGYNYHPYSEACFINNATSMYDADKVLDEYVCSAHTRITNVEEDVECLKNELDVTQAVMGFDIPECGMSGDTPYSYQPNVDACFISGATSMNDADMILDSALCEIYGDAACSAQELKKIEEVIGVSGNCDISIEYPSTSGCILSSAHTFAEADALLEEAICNMNYEFDSETPTASLVVNDENRIEVNVRLSHGSENTQTDEELTISSLPDAEFTNTNVLRIASIEGESADSPYNGLYLSNVWDCEDYDGEGDGEVVTNDYSNRVRMLGLVSPDDRPRI